MKEQVLSRLMRIVGSLTVLVTALLITVGVVDASTVTDFLAGSGTVNALAADSGSVVEGETSTTETAHDKSSIMDNYLSKQVTKMAPGKAPLDTILREMGIVVPINSWETEWYAVDQRGMEDSLASNFDTSASGTVDSSVDPNVHTIEVNSPHIWSVDDTILFQDTSGDDGMEIVGQVVEKNSPNLGVVIFNASDLPDLSSGAKVTRIGNAKAEKDIQTAPYTIYPQKQTNFCQIHMRQVEESVYKKMHKQEIDWGFADHRAQSLFDMRNSMEFTSIFGKKAKITDPIRESHDEKYFSDGIIRNIDQTLQWSTSDGIAETDFIDWTKDVFTGNSGSETRILFAGSDLMSEMSKIDTIKKQLEGKNTQVKWGIEFNEIVTNFGRFLVKHHDLMNFAGWAKNGLVLDVNNLERHVFKQMETQELDLIKSGQKNVNAAVISETFCVVTRYPDTHRIIECTG